MKTVRVRTTKSKKTARTLAYAASTKPKHRTKPAAKPPAPAAAEPPKAEPAPSPAAQGFRDLDDTYRLLAEPYEPVKIGSEDSGTLSDLVYLGFASGELKLEVNALQNIAAMANGILMANLGGDSYLSEQEHRQYVYQVARDIRDRSRALARLLDMRDSGAKKAEKAEGGAS
jgi:hypothetical protein